MAADIQALAIPEVKVIQPPRVGDSRGFFSETYNKRTFADAGIAIEFVQDNHAYSAAKHTLRGLHFQVPPHDQAKLVRVVRGAILDVAVDIRDGSPTFGHHVTAVISAAKWNQILVPAGFAHGLLTLEPDTEVLYKVSDYYAPDLDKGLFWGDPALGIAWGVEPSAITISDKDRAWPKLGDLPAYFQYGAEA